MNAGAGNFEVGNDVQLVQKFFFWPHGGKQVLLGGSFTSWEVLLPMIPMDACPSVFQLVCNLVPGYYQYKFYVDGEWLHDENQPFENGDIGPVNVTNVGGQQEILPAILCYGGPGLSHMEVDNGVFGHLELIPRMPESEVNISRYRISSFLSSHTAYELVPNIGKVVNMAINLPVKQAFHSLYKEGLFVAPVWDTTKSQFVGMLSAIDIVRLLKELEIYGSKITQGLLETYTIEAWREAKIQESGTSTGRPYPQRFAHVGPHESLRDVAFKILENKVATVPIIRPSSGAEDFPQALHIASLTGILKCICMHFKNCPDSLPILHLPIGSMPLGTWVSRKPNEQPIVMLNPSASLGEAMDLLIQADISSIVIVKDTGSYHDIYSRRDVMGLVNNKRYASIGLNWTSIQEALDFRREIHYPSELRHGSRCHMCFSSDPLHKVMARMLNPGIRQLVVVEEGTKLVEGIISIGDLFRFFLS